MRKRNVLLYIFSLCIAAFFITTNSDSTSPLFHGRFLDSDIFQYIGFAMTKGKIPYTDYFDHKGLFLYWIEAIGYILNPYWGVFLLQIVNLSIVIFVWHRILEELPNVYARWSAIFLCLLALYAYYSSGNLTEEWSLLPISYPFLLYFRNQRNQKIHFSNSQLLAVGLCVGILILIRPNNVAPLIGLLLYCLFISLWKKEFNYIGSSIGLIFVGFLVPIIFTVVYMLIVGGKQGLLDMIYGTIGFNMEYSFGRSSALWGNLKEHVNYIYKVILPLFPLLFFLRRNLFNVILVIMSTIITLISLGGIHYHYLIVFIPLLVISISCITNPKWLWAFVATMTFFYGKTFYRQFDIQHFYCLGIDPEFETFEQVLSAIPESERDSIWNMGGGFLIRDFKKAELLQRNRMFLLFQLNISPSLYKTESHRMQEVKPKYVIGAVFSQPWMGDALTYTPRLFDTSKMSDEEFVNSYYSIVSSAYCPDGTKVICYKRN